MKTDKRVWKSLFAWLSGDERDRIAETLRLIRLDRAPTAGRSALPRPEAVAGDRHAADAGTQAAAARRAGRRHDRRRDQRTAELFVSLAGKHSLVVVEHDMAFIESSGGKVTVLHEGSVLAEGDLATVQNDPRVIEVLSGALNESC